MDVHRTEDPAAAAGNGIEARVARAAEALSHGRELFSAVDVFVAMGWLAPGHVDLWRQGRIGTLVEVMQVAPAKRARALDALWRWATGRGLEAVDVSPRARTRAQTPLRASSTGDPAVERLWMTAWSPAGLPTARRDQLARRESAPPDLVVISPLGAFTCTGCGGGGDLLLMEGPGPLCMACAHLDHLVFLPAGDATVTRRARKASAQTAVVVRFSRSRKRYERQGLLVEAAALERARRQTAG